LVWSVKQRFHLIDDPLKEKLKSLIQKKSKELKIQLLSLGINPEHVHLIIGLRPVHYIPVVVKQLKGFSARKINRNKKEFIKWTRGYSIRTISERNLKAVIRYVRNQEKHHKINS
jgi:REP element-mobilizing transposase RayT